MKILCLLVILANIFLLLWEYRAGAFTVSQDNLAQHAVNEREYIFLVNEIDKKSQPLSHILNHPTPQNSTASPLDRTQ